MRSLLCTLVTLSLFIPHATAQAAVLIGLHIDDLDQANGQPRPSYRTFLITFRDGRAQLVADLPDLIVPRKDGFWRVGTLHKGPTGKYQAQEFVYATPARSVPHAVGEYHPPNPDWSCSETDQATEFVNTDLLSVSYFTEPACSLEVEYQHGTYKLDPLGKELDITSVLGTSAWDAEKKADAQAKSDHAFSDLSNCEGVSRVDSWNWGIERSSRLPRSEAKAWGLVSDYTSPHVCGDGGTYEIKFPIPESLTGPTYRANDLVLLLKSKVAKDNYSSWGGSPHTRRGFPSGFRLQSARKNIRHKTARHRTQARTLCLHQPGSECRDGAMGTAPAPRSTMPSAPCRERLSARWKPRVIVDTLVFRSRSTRSSPKRPLTICPLSTSCSLANFPSCDGACSC